MYNKWYAHKAYLLVQQFFFSIAGSVVCMRGRHFISSWSRDWTLRVSASVSVLDISIRTRAGQVRLKPGATRFAPTPSVQFIVTPGTVLYSVVQQCIAVMGAQVRPPWMQAKLRVVIGLSQRFCRGYGEERSIHRSVKVECEMLPRSRNFFPWSKNGGSTHTKAGGGARAEDHVVRP